MKWAQHIAEGRPLDFSQKQINDFRYSLILDVTNGRPLCNMSTEPDHHSVECYGLSKDSVIDTISSCPSLKGKAQKTNYPSDSDSDFESPKKRPKKDPESNSHITPCNTLVNSLLHFKQLLWPAECSAPPFCSSLKQEFAWEIGPTFDPCQEPGNKMTWKQKHFRFLIFYRISFGFIKYLFSFYGTSFFVVSNIFSLYRTSFTCIEHLLVL